MNLVIPEGMPLLPDLRAMPTFPGGDGRRLTCRPYAHFPAGTDIDVIWAWREAQCLAALAGVDLASCYPETEAWRGRRGIA